MAVMVAPSAAASTFRLALGAILIVALAVLAKLFYNIFLHPLRKYPGPKLWAASRWPWLIHEIRGDVHTTIADLHRRYGPVVRIAADELSFTGAGAWKTIYGHRSVEMEKNLKGAGLLGPMTPHEARSIVTAERHQHSRMRKALSYAFSEKALKEQEDFLISYVDQLVRRLRECSKDGAAQDIVNWYNFITFDVIGDLSFGEPFGCLKDGTYHYWVSNVFQGVKAVPYVHALLYMKLKWAALKLTPPSLRKAKDDSDRDAFEKVDRRMARQQDKTVADRRDFLSYILSNDGLKGMTKPELQQSAIILIIAGSETTATFLSGTTYAILRHPHVYKRVVDEIRNAFADENEITTTRAQQLQYLSAVIQESFRYYPPFPSTFPRIVPPGGEVIEGAWVPGGTSVGVHLWSATHDSNNFHRPDDFLPERSLAAESPVRTADDQPASLFKDDAHEASQPFSFGPRNCIGRNLAYAELRLVLCKLLWHFDLRLAEASDNPRWVQDQKTALIWEKLPLWVELTDIRA